MTEAKYRQLKKRLDWLNIVIFYCRTSGKLPEFDEAVKDAIRFRADIVSKIRRYEGKNDKTN